MTEESIKELVLGDCSPEKEIPFTAEEYGGRLRRIRQMMAPNSELEATN